MKRFQTSEKVVQHLRVSIEVMRDNLNDLERNLNREDRTDEDMIRTAIHAFAWGYANASMGIENALNILHYRREEP